VLMLTLQLYVVTGNEPASGRCIDLKSETLAGISCIQKWVTFRTIVVEQLRPLF
jgi:hypothetical protein